MVVNIVNVWVVVGAGVDFAVVLSVFVLLAREVLPSVCVVPRLLAAVEEEPADVPGTLVEREGDGVGCMLMTVGDILGVIAELVLTLKVVSILCDVEDEGTVEVGDADVLEALNVEVRLVVMVKEPVVLTDVGLMVVSVVVGIPVLAEDGVVIVDVCSLSEQGFDGVSADVVVLPVDWMFEEVAPEVVCSVVRVGVVTLPVRAVVSVPATEGVGGVTVIDMAGIEVSVGVVLSLVAGVTVGVRDVGVDVTRVGGSVVTRVDGRVVMVVKVGTGSVVEACGDDRSTLVGDVHMLVVTGVEVVDVGEDMTFVGVIDDVTGGGAVLPVVGACVGTSLVGVRVVFPVVGA